MLLRRKKRKHSVHVNFFFPDYYFVKREEFEELIKNNGFLEYAQFSGNMYGTRYVQRLCNI